MLLSSSFVAIVFVCRRRQRFVVIRRRRRCCRHCRRRRGLSFVRDVSSGTISVETPHVFEIVFSGGNHVGVVVVVCRRCLSLSSPLSLCRPSSSLSSSLSFSSFSSFVVVRHDSLGAFLVGGATTRNPQRCAESYAGIHRALSDQS